MSSSVTRIALWAPSVLQILLITAACWRTRLTALSAIGCSALAVIAMFVALVAADLEAAMGAFASATLLVAGIWAMVVAFQRSSLAREDEAEDSAVRLARFLDRQHPPPTADPVRLSVRSFDRPGVVWPEAWRERKGGRTRPGAHWR